MTGRAVFLGILLVCLAADAERTAGVRKPFCPNMGEIAACPMHLAPVCGSDGITYANECALCVQKQETKAEIFIVKEDSC